jgi:hypothetical protein
MREEPMQCFGEQRISLIFIGSWQKYNWWKFTVLHLSVSWVGFLTV